MSVSISDTCKLAYHIHVICVVVFSKEKERKIEGSKEQGKEENEGCIGVSSITIVNLVYGIRPSYFVRQRFQYLHFFIIESSYYLT